VCAVHSLGLVPYGEACEIQRALAGQRKAQEIPDTLLLLEHPPVITLGRNARREHILSEAKDLELEGIEVVETNRGGDVTYHGPGQLVGYPILDLSLIRKDVVWYLRTLEEAMIRTIEDLGLQAERRTGMTGVWVEERKVAAIGVHISRWVTSHGFALNVETDLDSFRHIVPCGIATYPVGSLRQVLGRPVDRLLVEQRLVHHLGEVFGRRMEWNSSESRERKKVCQPPMC
jgi:lipoyl(octanoyl) transferase